ncbi:MAG: RNA 3'-terminal phosphate cyclase [candidate division WOR-3 bacterium]
MIEIDGSFGEGGGQILRTALALSSVLGKPFLISNIRKRRKKPGLLAQHLTGVRAVAKITKAEKEGDEFGSEKLLFQPKKITPGNYEFNVAEEKGSAGSVTLVAQSILPILFFAEKESEVCLKGGTHVPFSPIFDYLNEILLPTIKRLGYSAEGEIKKYGFYPVGGGEITLKIKPLSPSSCVNISGSKRGDLFSLKIISRVANLPLAIAERQAKRALERLSPHFKITEALVETCYAGSPGTYLFIKAEFSNTLAGFSSLGERGKPAERVAEEAVEEFFAYYQTEVLFDPHLADQVLIFFALLKNRLKDEKFFFTTSRITNHLLTNIWTIKNFIPLQVKLEGELGKTGRVEIE